MSANRVVSLVANNAPQDELEQSRQKMAELEQSLASVNQMAMGLLRSNSFLGGMIEFFERCSESRDPSEIGLAMENALAAYQTPYVFILNLPEQHYVFGGKNYVTNLQFDVITTLTLQRERIVHFDQYTLINFPYFSICLTMTEEEKEAHLDNLTRLAQVANFVLSNLVRETQEKMVRQGIMQRAVRRTEALLDNIMKMVLDCGAHSIQSFSDLKWTIQSSIMGLDLDVESEQSIFNIVDQLMEQFEHQQASTRIIENYIRSVKESLAQLSDSGAGELK
ncbi:hypothetical protein HCH_01628 [Hahella chejuensis KCTC 2396]|uniref:Uncharacterized protein n=1 Tax=Hahella chejuensis (strain KCTC 2396) TaxID=349521 RepID=Q2SLJ0_HAHCH|nr:hypothetical protein [Hahella chejuensis]ABC28484.1 hypothetical protein HCH_01628 [Hahella chejuensis KCTC 2396]